MRNVTKKIDKEKGNVEENMSSKIITFYIFMIVIKLYSPFPVFLPKLPI